MLRVKLEIVPFGDEEKAREIGRLDIFNKGIAYPEQSSRYYRYGVIEIDHENNEAGMYVHDVIHAREDGAWMLVRNTLDDLEISGPGPFPWRTSDVV